jgi:hypothetical protein
MCDIPLDLQRKFEQRWAARLARPVLPPASHDHRHETPDQQLAALGKAKNRRAEAAGLRSVAAVCERGDLLKKHGNP